LNDARQLERGNKLNLDVGPLAMVLSRLSPNPSSTDFITHPEHCLPIYANQAMRLLLLKGMPMLDDIDIARMWRGKESRGMQIPGMDAAGGRRGTNTITGSTKGKGKVAPSVGGDDEVSSDDGIPLQRRRRLLRSAGSMTSGPLLSGEWVLLKVTMPQPTPMAAVLMLTTFGGSGSGSAKTVKEVVDAAATIVAKKAVCEASAKEAMAKWTTDVATVRKATDHVAAQKATDDASVTEKATKETAALRAAEVEM
jgi:hypothetical protein